MINKIFVDKKGGDKVISTYWFFMLFIVAAAVVYMVFLFYGDPYDVRKIEVNLLANKVADCLVDGSFLNDEILSDNFDIEKFCNINFDVEETEGWNNDQFFLGIKVYRFDGSSGDLKGNLLKGVILGNENLESCSMKLGKEPYCIKRSFYSIDREQGKYIVEVLTSVRKTEKNE